MKKRILLISDSHAKTKIVKAILKREAGNYDFSVCLGDYMRDQKYFIDNFDVVVPGNNDWSSSLAEIVTFKINDHFTAIACHSDQFGYFKREGRMIKWAKKNNVNIIFCGHTHVPQFYHQDGIYIINPGSCAYPRSNDGTTYAIVSIDGATIDYSLVKVD